MMKVYSRLSDLGFNTGLLTRQIDFHNHEADVSDDEALILIDLRGKNRNERGDLDTTVNLFSFTPFPPENREETSYVPSDEQATDYVDNAPDTVVVGTVIDEPAASPSAPTTGEGE